MAAIMGPKEESGPSTSMLNGPNRALPTRQSIEVSTTAGSTLGTLDSPRAPVRPEHAQCGDERQDQPERSSETPVR